MLYDFSKKNKINCFASIWSIKDLKVLSSVSKEIVKIPSPESYNLKLIKEALKVFKRVVLSVGCLSKNELKQIFKYKNNKKLIVLHCVSAYPLEPEDCNFKKFHYLKKIFKKVGYSGHMYGIDDAVYALANKAVMIENILQQIEIYKEGITSFPLNEKDLSKICDLNEKFYNFNIDRGLGIQKKKKTYLQNIEEDGKIKLINKLFMKKIALFKSLLDQSDYSLITKSLKSGWLTHGKNNLIFEENFQN